MDIRDKLHDSLDVSCARRGLVLVVDARESSRRELVRMLVEEGFETLEAESGAGALQCFEEARPDMVFVDARLPGLDGYETTRRIKSIAGAEFVPLILMSCAEEGDTLSRQCLESGGDDFMNRPYDAALLKARLLAMERIRDLQRSIVASNAPLAAMLEREFQEQALAERVFSRAIRNRNVRNDAISVFQRSAALFSGDLVLTQHLPDGGLRILIGDFTGHGLAATIGALPVAEAFHAMTSKGVDDEEVLSEINRKLHELLPQDRFMSATLISVSGTGQYLRWWNGGMPSVWLRTCDGLYELSSHAVSLGVLPELPLDDVPRKISVRPGDGLLAFTDGLLEARNAQGQSFDEVCLRHVVTSWRHRQPLFPTLVEALERHCGDVDQPDDIAVLEIPLERCLFAIPEPIHKKLPRGGWTWSTELRGNYLAPLHSVESLLRPLGLADGLELHLPALETIVFELYANALEHGLAITPVSVKVSPDDPVPHKDQVSTLSAEKDSDGWIQVKIDYHPMTDGGEFCVSIKHNGKGFECRPDTEGRCLPPEPWGEGMAVLQGLCQSLDYSDDGRRVDAAHCWRH